MGPKRRLPVPSYLFAAGLLLLAWGEWWVARTIGRWAKAWWQTRRARPRGQGPNATGR